MKKLSLFVLLLLLNSILFANNFKDYNINEFKDMYQITLTFEEIPTYKEMKLDNPFRIVVDINDTILNRSKILLNINRDPFKQIRIAQFDKNTVRFVLEMTKKLPYTVAIKENSIIISISYNNENKIDTLETYIPVRIAPREDATSIGKIKVGETVKIINSKNGWFLILMADGQDGWVKGDSIKVKQ